MEKWLESVYSDGSSYFVSNPEPELGEEVAVRIRMYDDAPVRHVIVRAIPNGIEHLAEAKKYKVEHGLAYYEAKLKMTEPRMQYHFYLICDDIIYYYTQLQITTYIPDHTYDFVLLTNYRQPKWVKSAVFYQIFPERFCNGDPSNDVQTGEYKMDGHDCTHMASWSDRPLQYEQGFCMDFFGGDLKGIQDKIPYLKGLGVTALYINPIFEAPSVHKYDCIDYFHVDKHFGGDEALAELSKALHENGMKLVIDISINHTGIGHKWFNRDGLHFDKSIGAYNNPDSEERSYYFFKPGTNEYKAWAGVDTLPTLNYTSDALRNIVYRGENSVIRKWLKPPYNIDGWRFDVADVFARNDEIQLAHEVWPELCAAIKEENPQAYILAEDWGDCGHYLQGGEWDSPMNYYGCARVLRRFIGLPDPFGERNELVREVQIKYNMTAQDVKARVLQHLAKIPFVVAQNQFNLIDSHDVSRVHNHDSVTRDAYRAAVILQFMLVGTPSIYYGDEAAVDGWTENNEGCRFPMPWHRDFQNTEHFRFYQTLAHLKLEHDAMKEGGMKFLYAEGRSIVLARFDDREALVAVVSGEDEERTIPVALGSIGAVLPADHRDIFGDAFESAEADDRTAEITVPAGKSYLIRCPLA